MKVVALISGGKDSTYNMMQCIAAGHDIVALAYLSPAKKSEIDSYMFQSVGFEAIDLIAAAMDLPLFRKETLGVSKQQGKNYEPTEEDEVEDLFCLLKEVYENLEVEAVSVGAILSDYQRIRVENVCIRLNLIPLAYLWQRDQEELLDEMIKCEIDAIIIKVAALGLEPNKHLGRTLSQMQSHLHAMHEKYGINVCGEGGEYETLTLDCPLFKSRIVIEESETILHSLDPFAPVGYLKLNKLRLETKLPALDLSSRLEGLPLKDSDGYITDDCEEAKEIHDCTNDIPLDEVIESNKLKGEPKNLLIRQNLTYTKSADGWLWIGGIQGNNSDSKLAMQEAMDTLKCVLVKNDHKIQDVCGINMFISSMSKYLEMNKIYCETFTYCNPPTRACVEVPLQGQCSVILEVLSWHPPENVQSDPPIERLTMHVQSRSHWAPANIGPYSQAVKIGEVIHLAGQIGLVPGSLEMVKGGIKSQCQLVLRHVGRLLKAVGPNLNLRDVVQGICYVTDLSFVDHARKLWEEKTNNAIVDYVVVERLPKDALVEWHVWAHSHNNQFEYEETGKCLENWSISIFRRWNYENNISAIVCYVDNLTENAILDYNIFKESITYAIQKLTQAHERNPNSLFNIKIFYSVNKPCQTDLFCSCLTELKMSIALVFSFVPVLYLKSDHTFLSICGTRYQ